MNPAPRRPTGSDQATRFMQWVWDRLHELRPSDSPTVRWSQGSRGMQAHAKRQPGAAAALPLRPFQVYTAGAADIFRIRGGSVLVRSLWPQIPGPELLDLNQLNQNLVQITQTDGIFDDYLIPPDASHDIILDDWRGPGGGAWQSCGIWAEVTQSLQSDGTELVETAVNHSFDPSTFGNPPSAWVYDISISRTTFIPIAIIIARSFDGFAVASSSILQITDSNVSGWHTAGPTMTELSYSPTRLFYPRDIVGYLGHRFQLGGTQASFGFAPGTGNWYQVS